jgi:hypothetical protein
MVNNTTPEQRAQKIAGIAKLGFFVIVGLGASFIIGLALKGLIGLIAFAAISGTSLALMPVVGMKVQNWKLKLLKAEAAANPIETLENEYRRQLGVLRDQSGKIQQFRAGVLTFGDQLEGFKAQFPGNAAKFDRQYQAMEQLLSKREKSYQAAQAQVKQFSHEIEKAKAIWEMSKAAAAASQSGGMTTDDFYAKIETDTALGSVQTSMNLAFSQLDSALLETSPVQNLPDAVAAALPAHA